MGKKYIIELERGTHIFVLGPEGIVHIGEPDVVYETVDGMQIGDAVINAKPYTEPDLGQVRKYAYKIGYEKGYRDGVNRIGDAEDKIRKEAYEDGYKTAKVQCNIQAEKDMREVGKKHYQKGLDDLWEAMQKAIKMYCEIDNEVFLRVFNDVKCDWGESVLQALFKNTPQHLIDSIRQYEQRQEEQIQVGDEVCYYGVADEHGNVCYSGVVLEIREDDYFVMEKTGKTYALKKKLVMSKTGRHFPEVDAVLEKMRGEQDG